MSNFLWDFKFGFRLLIKSPGFASIAVLALAVGIGANAAIFSVVYATLLAPLPYPQPDQLVMVWSTVRGDKNGVSVGDFLDWKRETAVFQQLVAWTGSNVNLSTSGRPEHVESQLGTPGFHTMMGHGFILGRDFLTEEGQRGKDHVVILTNRIWKNRFGADVNVIGKQVQMDGEPYTIVGVLATGPADLLTSDLYLPLAFKPEQTNHDLHYLYVMGRLKPGVTITQANTNLDRVAEHIEEEYPNSNKGWRARVEPLKDDFLGRGDVVRALWLLMGAVAFVLLIACANVANLLLARAALRQKEIALRTSLGASRSRLFSQLLAESIALSLIGCVAGIMLGWALLKIIMATMPPLTLPSLADVRLNIPVLVFTVALSLFAGVLFGSAPAWQATRINLNDALKQGGRSATSGRNGPRQTLIVLEFALALTLLTGGGLAIRSLWNIAHIDLGFKADHVFTCFLPVPDGQMTNPTQSLAFYRELHDRIRALPGVLSMSASEGIPFRGASFALPFTVEGKSIDDPTQRSSVGFNMVTPEYFRTFGIVFEKGRALTEDDRAGGVPSAVVNETFARKFLTGVDPLSQRVLVDHFVPGAAKLGLPIAWQIVGVYRDTRSGGLHGGHFPEIDVPFAQNPWPEATIAVRTAGDPTALRNSIADIVQSLNANLPITDVKTMDQLVDESRARDRFTALLFGGFAGVALLLAALGIYGVMSFTVAQRTREIGLRMALGANSRSVLIMILREGIILALVGVALGFVGAYFVGRGMQTLLVGIRRVDLVTFTTVAVLLLASALLACYVPARRATRVDPIEALRQE